jgi:phosphate transport system permease protein
MSTDSIRSVDSSSTLPILGPVISRRSGELRTSQLAYGQPWVWLFGGTLVICLVMILGLLYLILRFGLPTFWPKPVVALTTLQGGKIMGEQVRTDRYTPEKEALAKLPEKFRGPAQQHVAGQNGMADRELIKIGNFELTQTHHIWVNEYEVGAREYPPWAMLLERSENQSRFYGLLQQFMTDDKPTATTPEAAWSSYQEHHASIQKLVKQSEYLQKHEMGMLTNRIKAADTAGREQEIRYGKGSAEHQAALDRLSALKHLLKPEQDRINNEIAELNKQSRRYAIQLQTFEGKSKVVNLSEIVRGYLPNQLSLGDKWSIYGSRWAEFIGDDPRNSNTEGGVFPCIWGTLAMTIIMTLFVVPFGVLAALYLREYAKPGLLVSTIRIAVNNLAGVPSIVFGVFGLGFFCYLVGGTIDQIFYPASKVLGPIYGTGGLLWASLTLALLTVPVVIVATEEALAAVPRSMREGSYACGASKWQTILRIVLPRAMPGILTGTILAMARGAGEVAPLMLVGAMKIAPELPIDTVFPFVHPERSFMHLGFHIYDVGFQSPDSEAAKPMVFTTTLLLILLIALLNLSAMWLRNRLRRKYMASAF